ncbi:MAG: dihydropteroate synthase [Bacteroidales bacterium]|nr:dihydropteroate synthase [Bacteroidales bacterium]MDT8430033.1 dihydropteroate synthase [Bacteroidales bacterium]
MGILNVTPDSFFDGSRYTDPAAALDRVREMVSEGADIIDIGAASSRPGAGLMDAGEELSRLEPVMQLVRGEFPDLVLSVDTYNAEVAKQAVTHFEADIINDISAGELDPGMIPLIAKLNVPYIVMHMKGVPGDMQDNPVYHNVTDEIIQYFSQKVHILHNEGISDVLLDPGFGFGKTMDHNYELLSQVSAFQMFELPVVAGVSRKGMIYRLLESSSEEALNGTTAVHMLLLQGGINIIRVHDVKEAKEAVTIFNQTVRKSG